VITSILNRIDFSDTVIPRRGVQVLPISGYTMTMSERLRKLPRYV
jgi:hypothetical protein